MPRRAAGGDREAIERALSDTLRAALAELAEILDIWRWELSPLASVFTQAAVSLRAYQLTKAGLCSESDALEMAAVELGISPHTVTSRAKRWPRESRRGALCTGTEAPACGSVDLTTTSTAEASNDEH